MKWIFLMICVVSGFTAPRWHTDLEAAKKEAIESRKFVLLNFSGSDWCGPCIRLKEEVFSSDAFGKLADSNLVLCNADFPRSRKNQLPAEQQKRNEGVAEKYNPHGRFPYTVLLSPEGKLLRAWDGYPPSGRQLFLDQLKAACHANTDK